MTSKGHYIHLKGPVFDLLRHNKANSYFKHFLEGFNVLWFNTERLMYFSTTDKENYL